jgi:general secretion pathway protein H
MQTLVAGNKPARGPWLAKPARGFTLLELLVVIALIAIATAGASLALRDSADSALDRDAQRLAALLESARAQARASELTVVWRTQASGFVFDGLPTPGLPRQWLAPTTRASAAPILLGPEPLIPPQSIALSSSTRPDRRLWVVTDGLRPFAVQNSPRMEQR